MSKASFVCQALIIGVWATASAEAARLGPAQPFFIVGAPVGVAFAGGGDELIALGDGRLRAWDVATARQRFDLAIPGGRTGLLAATDDRIALIAGDSVELRRTSDGQLEKRFVEAAIPVQLAFADATTLAEADSAGGITLIDVVSGARRVLAPAQGGLACFAAGDGVVFACRDDRLLRWNIRSTSPAAPLHVGDVQCLAVASTSLAVAGGGKVRLLARDNGRVQHEIAIADTAWSLALSANGLRLAVPRGDGIDVYDVASGQRLHPDRPHATVRQVGFSADGRRIVARDGDGPLRAWHVTDGSAAPADIADLPTPPRCSAPHAPPWQMARDCRAGILVNATDGRVRIWRAGAGETAVVLPPRLTLLTAFGDHTLALATVPLEPAYDPKTQQAQRRTELLYLDERRVRWRCTFDGGAAALSVTADGKRLALALDDAVLVFVSTGCAPTRSAQPAPVRALAFSADGSTVAAGLADATVVSLPVR